MTDVLSATALDALGEVSNIGAGHAATSLSQLVGRSVELTVPAASFVALARPASASARRSARWPPS